MQQHRRRQQVDWRPGADAAVCGRTDLPVRPVLGPQPGPDVVCRGGPEDPHRGLVRPERGQGRQAHPAAAAAWQPAAVLAAAGQHDGERDDRHPARRHGERDRGRAGHHRRHRHLRRDRAAVDLHALRAADRRALGADRVGLRRALLPDRVADLEAARPAARARDHRRLLAQGAAHARQHQRRRRPRPAVGPHRRGRQDPARRADVPRHARLRRDDAARPLLQPRRVGVARQGDLRGDPQERPHAHPGLRGAQGPHRRAALLQGPARCASTARSRRAASDRLGSRREAVAQEPGPAQTHRRPPFCPWRPSDHAMSSGHAMHDAMQAWASSARCLCSRCSRASRRRSASST